MDYDYNGMTFDECVNLYTSLLQEMEYCKNRIIEISDQIKYLPVREITYLEELDPIWIDIPMHDFYGLRVLQKDYLKTAYKSQQSWRCLWADGRITTESFSEYQINGGGRDYVCPEGIVQIEVTPIVKKKKIVRDSNPIQDRIFPKSSRLSLTDIKELIEE